MAKLPKKSVAAKAIIKSHQGNVLLVKPNYKSTWQLPGGGIESGEEPRIGLVRELKEELSFNVNAAHLKLLDTVFRQGHDNLILIYEYTMPKDENQTIKYQKDELDSYRYEVPEKVGSLLSDYYANFWQAYITDKA